jgi:hypothetical protein
MPRLLRLQETANIDNLIQIASVRVLLPECLLDIVKRVLSVSKTNLYAEHC